MISPRIEPPPAHKPKSLGQIVEAESGEMCELLHTIKIILMEYQCSPGERDPASDSGSILKERLRLPSLAPSATAAGPRSKRGRASPGPPVSCEFHPAPLALETACGHVLLEAVCHGFGFAPRLGR